MSQGLRLFKHLFQQSSWKPKTFTKLQSEFHLPYSHYIHFYKITLYWKKCQIRPQQILERAALSKCYSISHIYPRLQMLHLKSIECFSISHWIRDFAEIASTEELLTGFSAIVRTTSSEIWKETNFKNLHRAYSTIYRSIDTPSDSKTALRGPICQCQKPSLAHAFWQCPQVSIYWDQINSYVNATLRMTKPKDPLLYLFGITDKELS